MAYKIRSKYLKGRVKKLKLFWNLSMRIKFLGQLIKIIQQGLPLLDLGMSIYI